MPQNDPSESDTGRFPRTGLTPEPRGDGLYWRLPVRPWGAGRWVPPVLILIGGGLLGFAIYGGVRGGGLTPGVLPSGLTGGLLGLLGVAMRFARGVIELNGDVVRAGDRLLGFGYVRTYPTARLRRLEVFTSAFRSNEEPVAPMPNFAMLLGSPHDERGPYRRGEALLAWGYPAAWLRVVARDLAEKLSADGRVGHGPDAEIRVDETTGLADDDTEVRDEPVLSQPANSRVLVERGADQLNFIVEGGHDHGLGSFAWIWNAIFVVFFVAMASNAVSGGFSTRDALIVAGIMLVAGGVGVAVAAAAFRMRRTKTILDIAGHGASTSLTLRTEAPFTGERVRRWKVAELTAVRVDRSGLEINDRPVMQLRLCPAEGKPVGTLTSLSHPELAWVAAEVRHRTGLPKHGQR